MTRTLDKENLWMLGGELDDLSFRLQSASRLVSLIHTAFVDGANKPDQRDFDALLSVYNSLYDLCGELDDLCSSVMGIGQNSAERDGAADVLRALDEEYRAGKAGRCPRQTPPSFDKPELAAIYTSACTAMYLYGKLHAEAEQK